MQLFIIFFMKKLHYILTLSLISFVNVLSEDSMTKLQNGHAAFLKNADKTLIHKLFKEGQKPHTIVVSCSDSRVPPEIIFNANIGELFVVRNAGNVVDKIGLNSIEFAAKVLNVKNVLILGHKACGAVEATIGTPEANKLTKTIASAVKKAEKNCQGKNIVDCAIKENIKNVEHKIKKTDILPSDVKIMKAVYNISNGSLEFFE